jgi:hypothetical protein
MSYLGLPAAAFRPWSPSKGGPGGAGYAPFPPCFSGTVPFSPHRTAPQPQSVGGPHHHLSLEAERSLSPGLADPYRHAVSSPPLLAAPPLKRKHVPEKGLFCFTFFTLFCSVFWVSYIFSILLKNMFLMWVTCF